MEKMAEVDSFVHQWQKLASTILCPLRSMLGKLFFMAQYCSHSRFFLNEMLETHRACPAVDAVSLLPGLKKTYIGVQPT